MRITRCPRCGQGALFVGVITLAACCDRCGLSYAGMEVGDGPAYIGILIVGTVVGIGASVLEIAAEPPFWVHLTVWVPLVLGGSLLCLRLAKAALLSAQYQLRKQDFEG